MNKQQLTKMHAMGYRYYVRETDASHIQVGAPICVKTIGDVTCYHATNPKGIFEIDDIGPDGVRIPRATVQILHQKSDPVSKLDLLDLLNKATTALLSDDGIAATANAFYLVQQYRQARANGAPEAKRLRCMFGVYRDSDECADQLEEEIIKRSAGNN